jgi:hypothetical protein
LCNFAVRQVKQDKEMPQTSAVRNNCATAFQARDFGMSEVHKAVLMIASQKLGESLQSHNIGID